MILQLLYTVLAANAYQLTPNVVYDTVNGQQLAMDIYKPANPTANLPVIVYTHGGCYDMGSKSDISDQLKNFADEGVAVFSLDYRLAPKDPYPAGLIDIQQAVRYIRKNAQVLGVDANRMAAHGESAGGYLASALGLRVMPDRNGNLDAYSARVPFVSDWYGRVNFTWPQKIGDDCAVIWLGMPRNDATMPKFVEASLYPYVNAQSAAFLIMQGDADTQVIPDHSKLLAADLQQAGRPVQLVMEPGVGHAFSDPASWQKALVFLRASLGLPAR